MTDQTQSKKTTFIKLNYSLLILLACSPLLTFFFSIFFKNQIRVTDFFYFWGALFVCLCIIYFLFDLKNIKFKKIKSKLLTIMAILTIIALVLVVISACLSKITINYLDIFFYVFLFISVLFLEKHHIKTFLFILISNVVFGCVLSFMDPTNYFIPGFFPEYSDYGSFFWQINYAQTVSALCLLLTIHLLLKEKQKFMICVYIVYFCILSLFMFLNSSSVGITAIILVLFVELIFLWIKNKKFPIKLFLLFLSFLSFGFIVELNQNLGRFDNLHQNYYLEMIAVFDNIFGTHLLQDIFNIDSIPSASGWERGELLTNSILTMWGNGDQSFWERLLNNLFGLGGGNIHLLRPHNMFVGHWVDFGLPFAFIHLTIVILGIIYAIKNSKKLNVMPFVICIFVYLFITLFGSMIIVHYIYFMIIFAIAIRLASLNQTEIQNEAHNRQSKMKDVIDILEKK